MAPARLKLPAYGKRLLEERRAGIHPLEITLVYGDKWWQGAEPKICIKPEDYEPGKYEFSMVAGARVTIVDQCDQGAEPDGKFYDLLREVAEIPALVVVRWPVNIEPETSAALEIAQLARKCSPNDQWPRWWNDRIDAGQRNLIYDWLAEKRKAANGRIAA